MVAIGTVIGPIAETVAPSLMKLVVKPVNKLLAIARPVPWLKKAGRMLRKLSAR